MFDLVVLGRVELTDAEGRKLTPLVQQPKRLALLTYLVLARGRYIRRDELLGLFWADSDQGRARNALKQAIHFLRRSLGPGVIASRGGDELGITEGSIRCDALTFEGALTGGDRCGALAVYEGGLLPGFHLDGCPDWQDWLDRERTRLTTLATAAAWELSDREETTGNRIASVNWARRARAFSPFDELSLRRLMRVLADAGDWTGALVEYERFAEWTRESFDDEPSADTLALADEIRSEAAEVTSIPAFIGPELAQPQTEATPTPQVDAVGPSPVPDNDAAVAPAVSQETYVAAARTPEPRRWRIPAWGLAALALTTLLSGAVVLRVRAGTGHPEAETIRIAVMPFQEFGPHGGDLARLGDALTATIANQLAKVSSFEVISAGHPGPPGRNPGRAVGVRGALDARLLITGTLFSSAKAVHLRYALVDGRSGTITRADSAEGSGGDLASIVDGLSRQVTSTVRREVGRERRRSQLQVDISSPRTRRLLQEAAWQREHAKALDEAGAVLPAQRALDAADSLLALASERAPGRAILPVLRAEVAEQMGWLYVPSNDRRRQRSAWERGIRFATSALALDAGVAQAWEMRGVLRYMLWGTSVADARPGQALLDSARQDLEQATALDHARPRSWSILSAILSTQGRLAEASEAAQQALAADRYLEDAQEILLRLYTTSLDLARDSDAVRWCAEIRERYQGSIAAAHCALGLLAWSRVALPPPGEDAWSIIREVREPPATMRVARPQLEMLAAAVLASRGMRDSAFAVIRRAKREPGGGASPPQLWFEALARAAAGDRAGAEAVVAEYARFSPPGAVRLRESRAFQILEDELTRD